MSEPTWPNHPQLFQLAGYRVRTYPYTDPSGRRIDEDALLAALGEASPGDTVLLHGSCHNPTGVDPSPALWRAIGDLIEERRRFPQASGDLNALILDISIAQNAETITSKVMEQSMLWIKKDPSAVKVNIIPFHSIAFSLSAGAIDVVAE